jgi:NAD binding domain of 6-phosphogluconate dehydrogenase
LNRDDAVEQTIFSDGGLASVLKPGAIHIGSSTIRTIRTKLARRLAVEHAKRGQSYVSAPVFGRPDAAEAKKLLVVTDGPAQILNFMIASMIESFGEAYTTLRKANVDRHRDLWVGINMAGREDNDKGYPLRFLDTFRRNAAEVQRHPALYSCG